MKSILLNWLPPAMENSASPALSVLKYVLQNNGFKTDVLYWNLKFKDYLEAYLNFGESLYEKDIYKLLPFYVHIAIEENDKLLLESLAYFVFSQKPQFHSKGISYLYTYFYEQDKILKQIITNILSTLNFDDVLFVGFSAQFNQWIIASIIAREIKKQNVNTPIIVGGFGTPQEAKAILENFNCFDFSSWGEGEYSTVRLAKELYNKELSNSIPQICYKQNETVFCTTQNTKYSNLDELQFDMSDYFNQVENVNLSIPKVIPVEAGRGCHWCRCKFCFLNKGYKFRTKSVEILKNEIIYYIKNFNISSVFFLDNDLVADNLNRFNALLDELINIREVYNEFSVKMAEVITKGLSYELIKKMSLANFESVQIGYESPSDKILTSISKKNTVASNLFFIKWAIKFGIHLNGVNILRNLLEEDEEGIKEGINNLYYMRFYLSSKELYHNLSFLGISSSSRYFKTIVSDKSLSEWQSSTQMLLPHNMISDKDKYILFYDYIKASYNPLWDTFKQIEIYYINNKYEYKFFRDNNIIVYRELLNNMIINELDFNKNDIHWQILNSSNKKIVSIDELALLLSNYSYRDIEEAIKELQLEGLLFVNRDKTEIFTIVNTEYVFS